MSTQPPKTFLEFISRFPELGDAHQRVDKAVESAGPMDARQRSLVKIGISLGAGWNPRRSHVRRAMAAGATVEEIEQAILLGMNTVGFPRTVAAWTWAHQQFKRDEAEAAAEEKTESVEQGASNEALPPSA